MKKALILGGLLAVAATVAEATVYSYNFSSGFANGGVIPDGNPTGWSDTRTIGLVADFGALRPGEVTDIRDVSVKLNISGTYNGDLYGYLVHSSGYAVLLNRVGRTSGDGFGYGDDGFNITLSGSGGTDIHNYGGNGGSLVTGTFQEDGRASDPATVLNTDPRTALLSSFNGSSADGSWTLFLADMSGGDVHTLLGWGLDISVVPEPTTWALIGFGVLAAGWQARAYWQRRRTTA